MVNAPHVNIVVCLPLNTVNVAMDPFETGVIPVLIYLICCISMVQISEGTG